MFVKMNQLLGAWVAGGVALNVAGIKCRPYMVSPLTRMLTLVQARSFAKFAECASYKVCDIPVGEKEKNYPQFMKPHRYAQRQSWFGSPFTGDVENRYLDYLGKLDWEPFENHVTHFPRKHRSKDEKWLIFERWAAHIGRKYPSAELMKMRFVQFKRALVIIDRCNSHGKGTLKLDGKKRDIVGYPVSCYVPTICRYSLKRSRKSYYHSFTPPDFCELAGTYEEIDYFEKKRWIGRDSNLYALGRDNKVYEIHRRSFGSSLEDCNIQ